MQVASQTVRPTAPAALQAQSAYQPYAAYQQPSTAVSSAAFGTDSYVPNGYVVDEQNKNVVYGQTKNMGLRILDRTLNLRIPYAETALIDKTTYNPMDIEEIDFDMQVKAAQVGVSDVDVTLTIEKLLNQSAAESGKKPPVQDLRVVFDPNNQIRVEGKVKALGMNIPFSVTGQVNVDTAGQIRYDLGKAKVAGIGVNGIMNTFGLSLDKLLKLRNPNDGYYTEGNSVYLNLGQVIGQQNGAPALDARVRGIRTTPSGQLQVLMGDTPADAQRALDQSNQAGPAYVKGAGGHAYIDGFFLKDGELSIYDRTPDTPLNLNAKGGMERNIKLDRGTVAVTEPRFQELIQDEIGDTDAIAGLKTDLENGYAKVSGTLFGVVPVSMHMTFAPTNDGRLYFEASKAKVLGFVPVPKNFVGGQLQKLIKTGEPYGENGVALKMAGMDLGYVSNVYHQDNYIILQSGK